MASPPPLDFTAPQFFCSALSGVAMEGQNVQLSFSSFVPNLTNQDRTYFVNVRIVMSSQAADQMIEFLQQTKEGKLGPPPIAQ